MATLEGLYAEVERWRRGKVSPVTERGYAHDWAQFARWCGLVGRGELPASAETLSLYLAQRLAEGRKVPSVCRYAAAVAYTHRREGLESPVTDGVKGLLAGARRLLAEKPRQMRPLSVEQVHVIAADLAADGCTIGIRDRALIVLGFASALRRSSLAMLRKEDVTFCGEGLVIQVRHEKQDRRGNGRVLAVPFGVQEVSCPVRCLRAWLDRRAPGNGALFTRLDHPGLLESLSMNAVWKIVKRAVARIGLDPDEYGPHSLRAGLITAAGQAGVSHLVIAKHSGHRSLDSLQRYFRPLHLFEANVCHGIGL